MNAHAKLTPASSQTVGPFFSIGLDYLADRTPAPDSASAIAINGRVLDRDGAPVPDAILEFWSADAATRTTSNTTHEKAVPDTFRRAATNIHGQFSVMMKRPSSIALEDGRIQAPHLLVLVFTRGLLRHLLSRVYFESDSGVASDPVLLAVPPQRRRTLIAQPDGPNSFRWDVILQGADETVFFAW
jgi:protocatechuate 3,4-dioxygenase alpha subunit